MKNVFNNLKLITVGLVLVVGVNYVYASTWTPRPSTPPDGNTDFPVNVGTDPQLKPGALSVDAFTAALNGELDGTTYFQGLLRGGTPTTNDSNIAFGGDDPLDVSKQHAVDLVVNGGIGAQQTITTGSLTSSALSKVCATPDGVLVLCTAVHVGLTANPTTVNKGGSSVLTVSATGFQGSVSCSIDKGVGTVAMSNAGGNSWTGTTTATNITATTTYTATCTGPSGTGTGQATVTPQVISGTISASCLNYKTGNDYHQGDFSITITLDKALQQATTFTWAQCDENAHLGRGYRNTCEGASIIPTIPSGYVVDNTTGPWTFTIPAGTTTWSSPVPWMDNHTPALPDICDNNGNKNTGVTYIPFGYLRLVNPSGGTLQFNGSSYQPDGSSTPITVYQVP
ncbi:MAG TPA: hypothetical protein VG621_00935 [Candidatus Paceibacterota bacterium]|nr:hypothetical protein [Candidatus Paceibacterota bacterium]